MEGIIQTTITAVASIVVACIAAGLITKKNNGKTLRELVNEVKSGLDEVKKKLDETAADNAENYIVNYIGEEERGVAHSESETKRLWINYRIYQDNGRNDYVHREIDKLSAQGKI